MASSLFPEYFGVRTTLPWKGGRFLILHENGFLKCNGLEIMNPQAKFAIEKPEIDPGNNGQQLVHIRSCYNNKYWVLHQMDDGSISIVSTAEKPDESESKMACTLFEPVFEDQGYRNRYRFRHYRTQVYAIHHEHQDSFRLSTTDTTGYPFEVTDMEKMTILPPRLTFKLDGNYLCSRAIYGHRHMRFEPNLDAANSSVFMELVQDRTGTSYRIKNVQSGKFWILSTNSFEWIWGEGEEEDFSGTSYSTVFIVGGNVIALQNTITRKFLGVLTRDGLTDCLCADYPAICKQTMLVIEEPVLSRKIDNITYRDSIIYNEQHNIELETAFAVNDNPDKDVTISLKFIVKDSTIRFWHGSVTVKLGVRSTVRATIIPKIVEGKVVYSAEPAAYYEWGESTEVEVTREVFYSVVVPPLSKKKVTLTATRGLCEVPFSYTQTDVLFDGKSVAKTRADGIFKGINAYRFTCESKVVKQDDTSGELCKIRN